MWQLHGEYLAMRTDESVTLSRYVDEPMAARKSRQQPGTWNTKAMNLWKNKSEIMLFSFADANLEYWYSMNLKIKLI